MEKPKSAAAVANTDTAVTLPAPKRRVSASLISADMTVPTLITVEITPA